jgi:uncharacterized protein YjbI with pentapeptide repeats
LVAAQTGYFLQRIVAAAYYLYQFEESDLKYTELIGVTISNSNLDLADLRYAKLIGVDFEEMNTFIDANLNYAEILAIL